MKYKILNSQKFSKGDYSIVPIRLEDRYEIMKWRNEQMYHLRQNEALTPNKQDIYFESVVSELFEKEKPGQILFSYLEGEKCIGYGGLVHINWIDKNAEISFIMNTELEKIHFDFHWEKFLYLIEKVAFKELELHKIFTYAFDIRPHLYIAIEKCGFQFEAELKEHCYFQNQFKSVKIHSKINSFKGLKLHLATSSDVEKTFEWANDMMVRKYSFKNDPILWDNHKEWFNEKVNSSNCAYYILRLNEQCIGSIRFDLENNEAKINYLIDPDFTGKGLGTKILEGGMEKLKMEKPFINLVYGYVFKDNRASIKIFENLGFKMISEKGNDLKFEKDIK